MYKYKLQIFYIERFYKHSRVVQHGVGLSISNICLTHHLFTCACYNSQNFKSLLAENLENTKQATI